MALSGYSPSVGTAVLEAAAHRQPKIDRARPDAGDRKEPGLRSALAAALLASGAVAAQRRSRMSRRFRDEEQMPADPDLQDEAWSSFRKIMSKTSKEDAEDVELSLPVHQPTGWSAFRPVSVVAAKISGKLNAELANGRLALLSASRDLQVEVRAKPTEEEIQAAREARKKFDLKELPSDEGYGWDPDQVDQEKPFDPSEEVGVTEPLGFFDPAGFAQVGDAEGFRFKRAAEIKHGRVAMMASVGLVITHWVRLPGFEMAGNSWSSQFNTIVTLPALYFFSVFIVIILWLELSIWAQEDDREAGNFGDPLGLGMYTTEWRNREINNGRFAMFATTGIILAQTLTGKDGVEQLGL
ncbi:FCPA [Symbiodinium natans]|uniref:FCPA protein n=1 Tax=Symbiodinium natans TaxID=878477 RepID=A0A812TN52_9DINO|nr:FCPA [Symbiodinium natans]